MSKKIKVLLLYVTIFIGFPLLISSGMDYLTGMGILPKISGMNRTVIVNTFVYVILPILTVSIIHEEIRHDTEKIIPLLKWIIPTIFLLYGISVFMNTIIQIVDHTTTTHNQMLLSEMQNISQAAYIYMVVFAAPITEEAVFRYAMLHDEKQVMEIVMLILSSACFGWIHTGSEFMVGAFITYTLLGFIFGCAYLHFHNLTFNILVHIGYNALSIFVLELLSRSQG